MIDPEHDEPEQAAADNSRNAEEEAAYLVDLWHERGESTDRVLARAMSRSLAGVIFTAAQNECPRPAPGAAAGR